jgi:hypothetical protein
LLDEDEEGAILTIADGLFDVDGVNGFGIGMSLFLNEPLLSYELSKLSLLFGLIVNDYFPLIEFVTPFDTLLAE